ncbi:MAG: DUF1127 domain-containing protein [Marinovum sp.]|nr:DUF1127 domain-containing protein [Marinovum sp.]
MAHAQTVFALTYLQNRPLTPAARVALFAAVVFVAWAERRRSRIALSHLDGHLLKDIGVTPAQAGHEFQKPFYLP